MAKAKQYTRKHRWRERREKNYKERVETNIENKRERIKNGGDRERWREKEEREG